MEFEVCTCFSLIYCSVTVITLTRYLCKYIWLAGDSEDWVQVFVSATYILHCVTLAVCYIGICSFEIHCKYIRTRKCNNGTLHYLGLYIYIPPVILIQVFACKIYCLRNVYSIVNLLTELPYWTLDIDLTVACMRNCLQQPSVDAWCY